MDRTKFQGTMSISYPSNGNVSIRFREETSGQQFMEVEITHEEFSKALSSLAERPIEMQVAETERLGKRKISQEIIVEVPKDYDKESARKAVTKFVEKQSKEDGKPWIADLYLGSQNSFFYRGEKRYARTNMYYFE